MLEVNNLVSGYGKTQIVKNITINIKEGEFITILGANGAGKTTLLMTISGIIKPIAGDIKFMGKEINKLPPHSIIKLGLAQVPQDRLIFSEMTVLENLEIGTWGLAKKIRNRDFKLLLDEVFNFFEILGKRKNQKASTLSGGEQQMLIIGRALMSRPKLLMLDEPSSGLAPILVEQLASNLLKIRKNGIAILLVEQNTILALELADRGYVLENGTIVHSGNRKKLQSDGRIKKSYLGL